MFEKVWFRKNFESCSFCGLNKDKSEEVVENRELVCKGIQLIKANFIDKEGLDWFWWIFFDWLVYDTELNIWAAKNLFEISFQRFFSKLLF